MAKKRKKTRSKSKKKPKRKVKIKAKPKRKAKKIVLFKPKKESSIEASKLKLNLAKFDIDALLKNKDYLKPKKKIKISLNPVFIGIAVLIVVLLAVLLFLLPGQNLCKTDECFIEAANECKPAILEKKIATADIRLEIKEGCVLNKKIIDMEEAEPEEVRNLFIGAEMNCNYDKGQFDDTYVEQISGNLGFCEGTLVDAVLAVL